MRSLKHKPVVKTHQIVSETTSLQGLLLKKQQIVTGTEKECFDRLLNGLTEAARKGQELFANTGTSFTLYDKSRELLVKFYIKKL